MNNIQVLLYQVIMATNRIETLDPALIRPGKLCQTSSLIFIVVIHRCIVSYCHMPFSFVVKFYTHILGRIDRKIEFPLPDEKTRRRIFQIHTKKMTLADDLDLEEYITAKDDLSGADIKVRLHCPGTDMSMHSFRTKAVVDDR